MRGAGQGAGAGNRADLGALWSWVFGGLEVSVLGSLGLRTFRVSGLSPLFDSSKTIEFSHF